MGFAVLGSSAIELRQALRTLKEVQCNSRNSGDSRIVTELKTTGMGLVQAARITAATVYPTLTISRITAKHISNRIENLVNEG